ncbi:hypothetical protein ART_3184 [Arthrobacter sp. PAMC 25486]|uniref:DUF6966 domain-containing protein n=1 Tax=Arthrobacter sp. PAMC 25486 TaxID=1494608 RepID=UPI0005362259|nr:hypothetical protein [Arthrobacter sp. PAMC 25486]AIY02783.1 hypothetical protein ART_3184 [Arthrobacter sp. PAMC 25486]
MISKRPTGEAVREEIVAAIAEVRAVAKSEHDVQRNHAAEWFSELFIDVTDRCGLREAAATALTLYGGWGSFSDVGTSASAQAVDRPTVALKHGRTRLLPNS